MKEALLQHVLSATGQIAAALPAFVVLLALSRGAGLESAGRFAVAIAVASAFFAAAGWGMRNGIVLDRFERFPAAAWFGTRIAMLAAASAMLLALAPVLHVGAWLIVGLALFRFADGIVDLELAARQVTQGSGDALAGFAFVHGAKLLVLCMLLGVAWQVGPDSIAAAFATAGLAALLLTLYRVADLLPRIRDVLPPLSTLAKLVAANAWFALAVAASALVTSTPRFSAGWLYDGDLLGVVGIALSVNTLLGIVLYGSWVRHFPNSGRAKDLRRGAARFLGEVLLITAAGSLLAWAFLADVVAALFDIAPAEHVATVRRLLLAGFAFFAGMSGCNLYKLTARAWLESAAYGVAAVTMLALPLLGIADMSLLLLAGGGVLLGFSLLAAAQPAHAALAREGTGG